MPDRKTSRKSPIHSAFDWIGDHIVGSIRMWRILQSPNASKILAHRSKKVQREAALQKKRDEWEERQQRRKKKVRPDRSHELTSALRLQRMRLKDFHRRTPARRLLLLYLAPTIVISLVFTGLFLLAPDHKTKATPLPQRPSAGSEDLEKVMEKTAQLLSENRLEEAEKYLDILNVRAPNDFTVLTYNGAINVLRKNYPAARAAYSKVLEITPGSPVAIYNLADIEFLTGNYAAAERGFLGMLD
ncbi:MAG: tetratricopeptide repeat protein, partial [Terrimicrobiaceae bacterium]